MKRYNHYKIVLPVSADEIDAEYVECKNGNWVRWKDVETLVGKLISKPIIEMDCGKCKNMYCGTWCPRTGDNYEKEIK